MSEEKIKMCYYNKTEPCLVFNISGLPMTQIEICNACKKKRKLSFNEIVNGMDEALIELKKNSYQVQLQQSQAENKRLREALEKIIKTTPVACHTWYFDCDNEQCKYREHCHAVCLAKKALGE